VLPVIIRTTEESLKAVDDTFKQVLGWEPVRETTSKIVFPIAFPNIITGLLSIGRVSGETAPILFTVAAYFYLNCLLLFSIRRWHCLIIYM
jgi:phosphate transport system permease protein